MPEELEGHELEFLCHLLHRCFASDNGIFQRFGDVRAWARLSSSHQVVLHVCIGPDLQPLLPIGIPSTMNAHTLLQLVAVRLSLALSYAIEEIDEETLPSWFLDGANAELVRPGGLSLLSKQLTSSESCPLPHWTHSVGPHADIDPGCDIEAYPMFLQPHAP